MLALGCWSARRGSPRRRAPPAPARQRARRGHRARRRHAVVDRRARSPRSAIRAPRWPTCSGSTTSPASPSCPARCCARTDAVAATFGAESPATRRVALAEQCARRLYRSPLHVVVTSVYFVHKLGFAVHRLSTEIRPSSTGSSPGSSTAMARRAGSPASGSAKEHEMEADACGVRTAGTPTPASSTRGRPTRARSIRRRRSCPECGKRLHHRRGGDPRGHQAQRGHRAVQPAEGRQRGAPGLPGPAGRRGRAGPARADASRRPSGPPAPPRSPAHEVGLAILGPLRELDEVAYLRFASVYQAFELARRLREGDRRRCAPSTRDRDARPGRRGTARPTSRSPRTTRHRDSAEGRRT